MSTPKQSPPPLEPPVASPSELESVALTDMERSDMTIAMAYLGHYSTMWDHKFAPLAARLRTTAAYEANKILFKNILDRQKDLEDKP